MFVFSSRFAVFVVPGSRSRSRPGSANVTVEPPPQEEGHNLYWLLNETNIKPEDGSMTGNGNSETSPKFRQPERINNPSQSGWILIYLRLYCCPARGCWKSNKCKCRKWDGNTVNHGERLSLAAVTAGICTRVYDNTANTLSPFQSNGNYTGALVCFSLYYANTWQVSRACNCHGRARRLSEITAATNEQPTPWNTLQHLC